MENARLSSLVEQVLRERQLTPAETETRVGQCTTPAYWTGLVPGAAISAVAPRLDEQPVAPGALSAAGERMRVDGYCGVPSFLRPQALVRLNDIIDAVTAAGWPAAGPAA